jgi:hypothetical protein
MRVSRFAAALGVAAAVLVGGATGASAAPSAPTPSHATHDHDRGGESDYGHDHYRGDDDYGHGYRHYRHDDDHGRGYWHDRRHHHRWDERHYDR